MAILAAAATVAAAACTKTEPLKHAEVDNESTMEKALQNGCYSDGDILRLKSAAATDTPVVVLILPEGYTRGDLTVGGAFEQKARLACEALFDLEPMKSLRDYVEVDVRFYASRDSGLGTVDKPADTYFNITKKNENGTDLRYNYSASLCVNDIGASVFNVMVLILMNDSKTGGRTFTTLGSDGLCISHSVVNALSSEERFRFEVWHECCGHAIGALADEYATNDGTVSEDVRDMILTNQAQGLYLNVSLTKEDTAWDRLIGLKGYDEVSCYEGAGYWSKGVYRSEENSVMRGNVVRRFNAISRYSIYSRIMRLTGNDSSWEDFLKRDSGWN